MTLDTWLIYFTTVFFITMSPGPSMMLCMAHGISYGMRRTLGTGVGLVLAFLILMGVSAVGLGALLAASETAFQILKWVGVAYLTYLGIKTWRAPSADMTALSETKADDARSPKSMFAQGFLVGISSPKAILFFSALFPQFLDPSRPQIPQLTVLALTFTVCEFGWQMAYATGGHRLAIYLARAGKGKLLNRISGGVLCGTAALVATVRRV